MVYETLYGRDQAFNPQPLMVQGHTIDDDGKRWTMKLRDGLLFHDGTPVLARDSLPNLVTEIVRRSDRAKGFVVLPKRWIPACAGTSRTIGWFGRCRRLAKDGENLNHNALAFIRLASIRLMLRKLCIPS
jgi:transposase